MIKGCVYLINGTIMYTVSQYTKSEYISTAMTVYSISFIMACAEFLNSLYKYNQWKGKQ